jgi:hypothetical protein
MVFWLYKILASSNFSKCQTQKNYDPAVQLQSIYLLRRNENILSHRTGTQMSIVALLRIAKK